MIATSCCQQHMFDRIFFFFFFGKNAFLNNKFLVNVWLERKKFFGFA